MRLLLTLFMTVLTVLTAAAQQTHEVQAKSNIHHVTVYLDGAQVSRQASVNVRTGKNLIIFKGLSPQLNESSLQLKTDDHISILSISRKMDFLTKDEEAPLIRSLRDSLELLSGIITAQNDDRDAFEAEKKMLLKNESIGGQNNGVSITDLKTASEFFRTRIMDINKQLSQINAKQTKTKEIQQRIRQQLQTLNSGTQYRRSEVSVLISSPTTGIRDFTLSYLVPGAGWVPVYDIRAQETDQPIKLTYRAKVFNDTEIDWNDAMLTLSTADPTQTATKPELKPWYLHYRSGRLEESVFYNSGLISENQKPRQDELKREEISYGWAGDLKKKSGDYSGEGVDMDEQQGTIIEMADLNIEFDIKDRYTVPADANPYMVEVATHELQATYKHYAAPKVEKNAFLIARVSGWEKLNLVTGYANIYFDGTYLGQSLINTAQVNDTLDVSLGRDKKVVVTREMQQEFSSKKVIGSNKKETFSYQIIVKNNRNSDIKLELFDQLPVSQDGEIEVSKLEISDGSHNELNGEVSWAVTLKPAESLKKTLSFAIKFPKNKPINTSQMKFMNARYF
ncbi:MAG: DUF4139 domain-containing protein [Flavobacteriales bacterium]|nr:DUF4139 domain-containing protein [Flavobacteriales bacterium]